MSPSLILIAALTMSEGRADVEAALKQELKALPGKQAVLFAQLSADGPQPLFAVNASERFAIGSSFKLFILGELIDEVNDHRRWIDNTMRLQADFVGPPSSELADWPLGSPVTLNTLAIKMISISDNTATDHLLHLLGRENVEQQQAAMGHTQPQWNRPFLFTREMTMIRDKAAAGREAEYAKLDEAGRRKFLATEIAGLHDYEKLDFDTGAYEVAEWFATTEDMARALNWIRLNTEPGKPAAPLREVLTLDAKLKINRETWPFVGFKGGSEDQLLAGNWLLRHKNGNWYSFQVFWNSPDEKLEVETMIATVQKLFDLLEQQVKSSP